MRKTRNEFIERYDDWCKLQKEMKPLESMLEANRIKRRQLLDSIIQAKGSLSSKALDRLEQLEKENTELGAIRDVIWNKSMKALEGVIDALETAFKHDPEKHEVFNALH